MGMRILGAAALVGVLLIDGRFAAAQPVAGEEAEQLTTRVYQLADMILPLPNHGYRPDDLPATPSGTSGAGGRNDWIGNLGGFGGGGGGLGGSAAFNVQIGGAGGGQGGSGLGGGGFGGAGGAGGGFGGGAAPAEDSAAEAMGQISDLIRATVEPQSWEDFGGSGTMMTYRSLLVVSQTAAIHAKIEATLEMLREMTGTLRTVSIRGHWLLLDSDQLDKLQVDRDGRTSIDREQLAKLTREPTSYRGQITCFSGQTVHLVGGQRRNVVTGVIPVVGGGGTPAYQPRGGMPNMGVLLQVRPTLVAGGDAAIVDLQTWVTSSPPKDATLEFQSNQAAAPSRNDAEDKAEANKGEGAAVRVDRLDIASQSLATTLRAPIGVPVLAGGLTAVPQIEGDSGEAKQLYLVVEVNVVDDAPPAQQRRKPTEF